MAVNAINFCYNQTPNLANAALKIGKSSLIGATFAVTAFVFGRIMMNYIKVNHPPDLVIYGSMLTIIGVTSWMYVAYGPIESLGAFLGVHLTTGFCFCATLLSGW